MVASIERSNACGVCCAAGCKKPAAIAVLIVKRTEWRCGGFQENIKTALWQPYVEIGNLAKYVAHRHIEGAALLERKAAQVVEKIILKIQPVVISLLEKLLALQTQRVTRLPGNVAEELLKSRPVLLLFFQPDVTINFNKTPQLFRAHLVVTFPRLPVSTFDAVECYTSGTQHALYFGEDRVFLFQFDVAKYVETDNVIETGIGKGQTGEFGPESCVVTVTPRSERALI